VGWWRRSTNVWGNSPSLSHIEMLRIISLAFVSVYGPNYDRDRGLIWDELTGLLSWWNLSWYALEDDFNVTIFPSERSSKRCLCPTIVEFSDFIFFIKA
jgi:hypothetical protein